jgi:hypothetical protein
VLAGRNVSYFGLDKERLGQYIVYAPNYGLSDIRPKKAVFHWFLEMKEGEFITTEDLAKKFYSGLFEFIRSEPGMKIIPVPPPPLPFLLATGWGQKPRPVKSSPTGIKFNLSDVERDTFYIVKYEGDKYAIRVTSDGYLENYSVEE